MAAKTLYICYFGVREPLVQTQVVPYLRELMKGDYSSAEAQERGEGRLTVSLLTFEPDVHFDAVNIRAELAAEGIEWHWLRYHKRPSVPATFFDVLNGARFIAKLMRRERFDILHARSHVPTLMGALGRKFSRRKPKLLFDIRGFFPEEYTDAGLWPEGGWLYRAAKRIERWLMKEADGFVVLTEKAREILFGDGEAVPLDYFKEADGRAEPFRTALRQSREESPSDANPKPKIQNLKWKNPPAHPGGSDLRGRPVEVIPCCVDLKRFESGTEDSRVEIRSKLRIEDRSVVVYVGSFGGWYLTDETADFFAAAREHDAATFAMVLTQSDPKKIESLLRERGFGDADFLITRVAAADIPNYLNAADLAVSFIKPCYSKQASSPTKNAEYLASGLPIIANCGIGDVDVLIRNSGVGALVRDFNRESYIATLNEVQKLGDIGSRCREAARREFDLETVGGERYRRLYGNLLSQ
ncbi:MAG: glycosyltransferase [Blastocatellia bacterium]